MKKRSPRDIPDFSSKRGLKPSDKLNASKPARPTQPPPQIKPQSTSAKSGRRGQ